MRTASALRDRVRCLASTCQRSRLLWSWLSLGYLFFVALPMLFGADVPARAIVLSALAVLLYLPLHFLAFRTSLRRVGWYAAAAAALGLALSPVNSGGNTFVIYAMVFCGYRMRTGAALKLAAAVMALYAAEVALFDIPWPNLWVTLIVGGASLFGGLWTQSQERHNAQLRLSQEEVQRLARMNERERIGRDLHDLLGHTLSVIALKSELAGKLVERAAGEARALAAARQEIAEVERVARESLGQVRRAVTGIRAAGLDAEIAGARLALLGADIELVVGLAPLVLEPAAETALALGLREATTNVLRHARAGRMRVSLRRDGRDAVLEIGDDGRGGVRGAGNGLTGMRERLEAVGGRVAIESDAAGTRLHLRVPLGEARVLPAFG